MAPLAFVFASSVPRLASASVPVGAQSSEWGL